MRTVLVNQKTGRRRRTVLNLLQQFLEVLVHGA
jgi:hypothetical protein